MGEKQRHYFLNAEHKTEEYFNFKINFRNREFIINSCSDIFSKDELDDGTRVLLETTLDKIITNPDTTKASFLDMGCGYGIIGIVLASFCPESTVDMLDINSNAVSLARKNADENELYNIRDVFVSDGYVEVINDYDYIITNPPIKAGKETLFRLVGEGIFHLKEGGKIVLVIRKDLGEESLRKMMLEVFGNCEILDRSKGFYILCSQKNSTPKIDEKKK